MASELIVQTLKGPTSGDNANKVIIPSGQTLDIDAWTPPAGTVLQVIEGTYDTQTDITATSYADCGLSATITPSSSSSKIYAITNLHCYINGTGLFGVNIVRDSTQIVEADRALGYVDNTSAMVVVTKLDSPSTTSAITYKVQVKKVGFTGTPRINDQTGGSRITLMEIAG